MTRTRIVDRFDMTRFRADVLAYQARWKLPTRRLADAAGCTDNAIMPWLRGDRDAVGLAVAAGLADVCDLSLDTYRRK